ncbi:MAG: hypothetical protein LBD46_05510 [Endomicrobium sp.]|nr:hypothetical protein [Endomicrobium sp.]
MPDVITGRITASNPSHTLMSIVKNNGVVQPNVSVTWNVYPSTMGVCIPKQSSSTVFTADTTQTGSGTIIASYNGVNSAPVNFSINEEPLIIDSVVISPSVTQSIVSTQTVTFTATAKAGTTTVTGVGTQITWTVTGPGSISPNPSNSGSSVTFTPSGTAGNAAVKASYGTVNSSVVNVVISTGTGGESSTKFLVYSDAGLTTESGGINYSEFVWTYPSGQEASPCALMTEKTDGGGAPGDTSKYFVIINNYDAQTNKVCGWNFKLYTKKDLTAYTKLVFYAKGTTASDKLSVEFGSVNNGDSGYLSTPKLFNLTTSWQKYEIDISAINRTSIGILANFIFANEAKHGNIPNETVYIDYIYFE